MNIPYRHFLLPFCIVIAYFVPLGGQTHEIGVSYQQAKTIPKATQTFSAIELEPFPFMPMGTYPTPFPGDQCTAGAASMKGNITWGGDANQWDDQAEARNIEVSDVPLVGAVAQSDRGESGHVAVVVNLDPAKHPGEVQITEKNYDYNGSVRTVWQSIGRYRYIYV